MREAWDGAAVRLNDVKDQRRQSTRPALTALWSRGVAFAASPGPPLGLALSRGSDSCYYAGLPQMPIAMRSRRMPNRESRGSLLLRERYSGIGRPIAGSRAQLGLQRM